jgi:hypothetical protein
LKPKGSDSNSSNRQHLLKSKSFNRVKRKKRLTRMKRKWKRRNSLHVEQGITVRIITMIARMITSLR